MEEAVHHLVDGAIPADGDDAVVALAERLPGEIGRMHRLFREGVLDVADGPPHRLRDAVEVTRGRAVGRPRIDDQERFQGVPCASQRARTETTSVAPRAAAQAGLEVAAGP